MLTKKKMKKKMKMKNNREEEDGGGRERASGYGWSERDEPAAVNSDSWPSSRGSSILMVVLRAVREEGWPILGCPPPHLHPPPSTAWLTQQGRRWVNSVS